MEKDEAFVAIRHAVNKGYSAAPPYNQLFEAVRAVKDILDEQNRTEQAKAEAEAEEKPVVTDRAAEVETLNALWRGSVVLVRDTIDSTHAWTKESESYTNEKGAYVSERWVAPGKFFVSSKRLLNRRGEMTFEILYDPSLADYKS